MGCHQVVTSETSVRQLSRDTEFGVEEMNLELGTEVWTERHWGVIRIYMVLGQGSPGREMSSEKRGQDGALGHPNN